MRLTAFFLLLLSAGTASVARGEDPPRAEKRPHPQTFHGVAWTDDYYWLRDREDSAVRAYLEAENAYTAAQLAPLQALREQLATEMKARIVEEDVSVPFRKGDWLYFNRDIAGKERPLLCRKPFPDGEETILLDRNERAGDSEAYSFGGGAISPDGKRYAWKENHDGTDLYTVRFKDAETGELLPYEVPGAVFSDPPVWAMDNRTLFYTEADDKFRSWRVKRHLLGTDSELDTVVYEEPDARFQVWIGSTRSERYLRITSSSKDTMETSLLPLDRPDAAPRLVAPRREGVRYALSDCGDQWFILTTEGAIDGRVMRAPLETPEREHWIDTLPGDDRIVYSSIEAFATHVVIGARRDGIPGMFLLDPSTHQTRWVTAPKDGAWFGFEATPHYLSAFQRVSYETFLDPHIVAEVDLASGDIRPVKHKAAPPGYDPSRYRVERVLAPAKDGTGIPVWLLLPADHPKDGSGALLLSGYGAYGSASDPCFDSDMLSLLDRGVGYALAQPRGGGEMGRRWYEAGKLANKQTTFDDYIACAEHLVREGYVSPQRLCGYGGSAGGLLAGAVLNQRPDLFRAFVAEVPFVDTLNTMLDPTIPLTTSEYDEWGNPSKSKEVFERIRSYSPYDNIAAQDYPALLVLASWNDTRVPYWEAAKWVAKLRAAKTDANPLLLSTEFDHGHGGASGRYSYLDKVALQYAFVVQAVGKETP